MTTGGEEVPSGALPPEATAEPPAPPVLLTLNDFRQFARTHDTLQRTATRAFYALGSVAAAVEVTSFDAYNPNEYAAPPPDALPLRAVRCGTQEPRLDTESVAASLEQLLAFGYPSSGNNELSGMNGRMLSLVARLMNHLYPHREQPFPVLSEGNTSEQQAERPRFLEQATVRGTTRAVVTYRTIRSVALSQGKSQDDVRWAASFMTQLTHRLALEDGRRIDAANSANTYLGDRVAFVAKESRGRLVYGVDPKAFLAEVDRLDVSAGGEQERPIHTVVRLYAEALRAFLQERAQ